METPWPSLRDAVIFEARKLMLLHHRRCDAKRYVFPWFQFSMLAAAIVALDEEEER
jgi:hypothetical protein